MLGRQWPEHVRSSFAADHIDVWVRGLTGQAYQRKDNRHDDSLERAEDKHAEEGRQRPSELHSTDSADRDELGWLDKSDGVNDYDCRQHGLGQQAEQRGQKEHGSGRGTRL